MPTGCDALSPLVGTRGKTEGHARLSDYERKRRASREKVCMRLDRRAWGLIREDAALYGMAGNHFVAWLYANWRKHRWPLDLDVRG